jgi:hypothetical protein
MSEVATMRRTVLVLGLLTCSLLPVSQSSAASDDGAILIRDRGCSFSDFQGGVVIADTDRLLVNHNRTIKICKAKGVPNDTGRAMRFTGESTGLECGYKVRDDLFAFTFDWHMTISASGVATTWCTFPTS